MGEPAYGGAEGPRPGHPQEADLDPRRDLVLWAETCAKQVAILASRPDDDAALEMARLCLAGFDRAVEMDRHRVVDEVVLNEAYATGWREGYEACKEQRRRLGVIDGGQATPGPH